MNSFKRDNTRHKTIGILCSLFDGDSMYVGIVEDLSVSGFRAGQVPLDYNDSVKLHTVTIHSLNGDFNIEVIPRWSKVSMYGMYKEVGFQIDSPPKEWVDFSKNFRVDFDEENMYPSSTNLFNS